MLFDRLINSGLIATGSSAQTANPKRVFLLHSFGPLFKPWSDYGLTIRMEVARQARWPIEFSDFSLVNARSNDDQSEASLVQYLRTLYAPKPLDLIIAIGAPAASFIQRHRSELCPTTPMIFTAVDQRRVDYNSLSENDTVVPATHDFAVAFRTILKRCLTQKTLPSSMARRRTRNCGTGILSGSSLY